MRRILKGQLVTRPLSNVAQCNFCPNIQVSYVIVTFEHTILIPHFLGDPTTPGYPAYKNATRTEGENIPKIPSIPISWANAQKLLAEIGQEDVSRQLTGSSSSRKIKMVNHGGFPSCRPFTRTKGDVSRYQGHAHLEHNGCYPWSYQERDCHHWLPQRWWVLKLTWGV